MPISRCENCGESFEWSWFEAFDKFGFGDGDGQIETERVADMLERAGYNVITEGWGLHNTLITSIERDGLEHIPQDDPNVTIGYDDPRNYLPQVIINLLDEHFPDGS